MYPLRLEVWEGKVGGKEGAREREGERVLPLFTVMQLIKFSLLFAVDC